MPRSSLHSPRRIDFAHRALRKITFDDSPPAADSITWKLWLDCQDIARQALASDYVQGIAGGTLDPNRYGRYNVQDGAYCHNAQEDYATIEARAQEAGFPQLAAFAQARYEGYLSYTDQVLEQWHIADAAAISVSEAVRTYIDFEHHVANQLRPIYGVVAMIPCDQLWPWLATELEPCISPHNVYSFWIRDNGGWSGSYRLDNFVDAWFAAYPEEFHRDQALWVYQSCMTCELNFFRSAGGQSLAPMPEAPSPG